MDEDGLVGGVDGALEGYRRRGRGGGGARSGGNYVR